MRARTRLSLSTALLIAGPIAASEWRVHRAPDRAYMRVTASVSTPRASGTSDTPSTRVSRYLAHRNALVDVLLPEGEGGTQFYVSLDSNSGEAFSARAAIAIAADAPTLEEGEHVELHERAHLLHAFAAHPVNTLLRRVGPPAQNSYAAKNSGEHFGEMAVSAWSVLVEPRGVCSATTPLELLHNAERDVPGTAGFVEWYLRNPRMLSADARDSSRYAMREELRTEALRLSAPLRAEWENIWRAVESRRNPDGTFSRWRAMTVREDLESFHARLTASRSRVDRMLGVTLWPSVALMQLVR